jgi:hypothetical protein
MSFSVKVGLNRCEDGTYVLADQIANADFVIQLPPYTPTATELATLEMVEPPEPAAG